MTCSQKNIALIVVSVWYLASGCQEYGFGEVPTSNLHQKRQTITTQLAIDILFVVDNSGSMLGEQRAIGQSFSDFSRELDKYFGPDKYRIAVITTGMESTECRPCTDERWKSCTNETGESGRFQARLGWNVGTDDAPEFQFEADPTCRIITSENADRCLYHNDKGIIFVGVNGCGYERGLEAMKTALSEPLLSTWNADFLRDEAALAVVVISDEEDCGKPDEISEGLATVSGKICYYAAKGEGPTGLQSDAVGNPYTLTPVSEYYDFLVKLKGDRNKVKFAAIVGVEDAEKPIETVIRYENNTQDNADILAACTTANCQGQYCNALPTTRYIQLAQMFGINQRSYVDTICQDNFSDTMNQLGEFIRCPKIFGLSEPVLDSGLVNIAINDNPVPRFTCQNKNKIELCEGVLDTTCSNNSPCLRTWELIPPQPSDTLAPGGEIRFADHYNPCLFLNSSDIKIDLIYASE